MSLHYLSAAKAYGLVGLESGIGTADPHRLVMMLFDGAIDALRNAKLHMRARRIADKGMAITRAIRIIEEGLKASLDAETGGKIAASLSDLYDFMGRHLLAASRENNEQMVEEVLEMLHGLRGAWAAIEQPGKPPAGPKGAWSAPSMLAAA